MKKPIVVCGPICSGKTTWCTNTMRPEIDAYLKISTIVSKVSGAVSRQDLQDTQELKSQIIQELLEFLKLTFQSTDTVYIDGIRQIEILEELYKHYPNLQLVWMNVPTSERKRRYESRADLRDSSMSFEEADRRDFALGLDKIHTHYHNINKYK